MLRVAIDGSSTKKRFPEIIDCCLIIGSDISTVHVRFLPQFCHQDFKRLH